MGCRALVRHREGAGQKCSLEGEAGSQEATITVCLCIPLETMGAAMRYSIFAVLLAITPAHADFYVGHDLLRLCQENPTMAEFYIAGALDRSRSALGHNEVSGNKSLEAALHPYCVDDLPLKDIRQVVCKSLETEPQPTLNASILAVFALRKEYPCSK